MCGCGCGKDHCWHSYPERGWIQFLILRILHENPTHGYELMRTLEERSCGCHRLETGSIYTLLRRMDDGGLLESEWTRSETTGPERRVYKVTERGTEALKSGLESIVKRKAMMDDLAEYYKKRFMKKEEGGE